MMYMHSYGQAHHISSHNCCQINSTQRRLLLEVIVLSEPIFNIDNIPTNTIKNAFLFNEPIAVPRKNPKGYRVEYYSPLKTTNSMPTSARFRSPLLRLKQVQMSEQKKVLTSRSYAKVRSITRPTSKKTSQKNSVIESYI